MHKHLHDITPASTSYEMGMKRVLLSSNESGCSITQIAVLGAVCGINTRINHRVNVAEAGECLLCSALGARYRITDSRVADGFY